MIKHLKVTVQCETCGTALPIGAVAQLEGESNLRVNTKCSCYEKAVADAYSSAVSNMVSAVESLSKKQGR